MTEKALRKPILIAYETAPQLRIERDGPPLGKVGDSLIVELIELISE